MLTPKQVVKNFWQAMQSNDFISAGAWLSDDFVCDWVLSNERIIGRDNYIAINQAYPLSTPNARWNFTLNRIIAEGDKIVTEIDVTDGTITARAVTFHTVKKGKICHQTEYWLEPYPPQQWRKKWVVAIDKNE